METLTQIELVDRENNVISTQSIPATSFPLTIRLVPQPHAAAATNGASAGATAGTNGGASNGSFPEAAAPVLLATNHSSPSVTRDAIYDATHGTVHDAVYARASATPTTPQPRTQPHHVSPVQETSQDTPQGVPTARTQTRPRWFDWTRTPLGTLTTVFAAAAIFVGLLHSNTFEQSISNTIYFGGTGFMIVVCVWSGLWALGGRVTQQRGQFREQLIWTCVASMIGMATTFLMQWVEFLFPDTLFETGAGLLLMAGTVTVALYGHMTIASRLPSSRRWYTAGLAVAFFLAFFGLGALIDEETFDTDLDLQREMRPLDARFIPAQPVDAFTTGLDELQTELETELTQTKERK